MQRQCWPAALTGADVLGIAPTGSGKTIAYLLPSVPHIGSQIKAHGPLRASEGASRVPILLANVPMKFCLTVLAFAGPISLVIVPTRELAQQVANAAKPLKSVEYGGIRTLALYGGGRDGKDAQLGAR